MERRRELLLSSWVLLVPLATFAQPAARVRRIGVLGNLKQSAVASDLMPAFIATLRDLGWREGQSFAFEYRFAEQHYERFPDLARELAELDVDLILVTAGTNAALAAKQSTATIPILAVGVGDPVKFGLVSSFARPGGNVTALSQPIAEWGKFLELTREAVPGATRIAVMANPLNVGYADYAAQMEAAARQLGLKLQMISITDIGGLATAFDVLKRGRAEALVFAPDGVFFNNLAELLERARTLQVPVIGPISLAAEMGALVSWGFDIRHVYRRAAAYADRILRGTRPADLPVEQTTRFELVVNLKTARELGLTVSRSLLQRADVVIE